MYLSLHGLDAPVDCLRDRLHLLRLRLVVEVDALLELVRCLVHLLVELLNQLEVAAVSGRLLDRLLSDGRVRDER